MINENVKNWLAERGFAERLTEHNETTDSIGWCDVCKGWEE